MQEYKYITAMLFTRTREYIHSHVRRVLYCIEMVGWYTKLGRADTERERTHRHRTFSPNKNSEITEWDLGA